MTIILLLGIHFLLITIYAYTIMLEISRLHFKHLVFALFFPFVGEICLLASETVAIPAQSPYLHSEKRQPTFQKKSPMQIPENWREIVMGEENQARLFLMNAIDNAEESRLPQILKSALRSESSEVSHIAAAGLMRLIQKHEDAISLAMQNSNRYPGNAQLIASHIEAVRNYRLSGLPATSTYKILMKSEKELLTRYLRLMPQDSYYINEFTSLSNEEAEEND